MRILMFSLLAGICVALLAGVGCGKGGNDLVFKIVFDDAKGLQPGQFVVYKGLRIGEVTQVSLDPGGSIVVEVKIKPDFRTTVYREAEFMIVKPEGLTDLSGEKQVMMSDRPGNRSGIEAGEVVRGTNGIFEHWLGKAQDFGGKLWDSLKNVSGEVVQSVKGYASSPEGEALLSSMKQFVVDAKDLGYEQYQSLRNKSLPELQEKARELKDKMERDGRGEDAKQFWDDFTVWMQKTEKAVAEK